MLRREILACHRRMLEAREPIGKRPFPVNPELIKGSGFCVEAACFATDDDVAVLDCDFQVAPRTNSFERIPGIGLGRRWEPRYPASGFPSILHTEERLGK